MANRRNILIGAGATAVAAMAGGTALLVGQAAPALAADSFDLAKMLEPAGGVADHPLGSPDNKVVLIEYLSPTCPHCKDFALNQFPALKTEYIDTNKIKFIPRPFVRNVQDAVVFMLAEAAGPELYHSVVDTYFKTYDQWVYAEKPSDAIFTIAQQFGFTRETFDAALTNQTLFTGLEAVRDQASNDYKLQGTPTFYLNGTMYTGAYTSDGLKAAIDPLLG